MVFWMYKNEVFGHTREIKRFRFGSGMEGFKEPCNNTSKE
jgi:hypothetical protein